MSLILPPASDWRLVIPPLGTAGNLPPSSEMIPLTYIQVRLEKISNVSGGHLYSQLHHILPERCKKLQLRDLCERMREREREMGKQS